MHESFNPIDIESDHMFEISIQSNSNQLYSIELDWIGLDVDVGVG